MNDSLKTFIQIKQDDILLKNSHLKNNIVPSENKHFSSMRNFSFDSTNKQIAISNYSNEILFVKDKEYIIKTNTLLKTYFSEPWNKIISVNNQSSILINKEREIYNKKSSSEISFTSKMIQEFPHFYKDNIAINNSILILIIISFVLLVWVKVFFDKYLTQLLQALINYNDEAKLYNDHNTIIDRLYLLLNSIFTITGGVFIYYIINYIGKENFSLSPMKLIFLCMGLIISLYAYRYLVDLIFGFVLNNSQLFNEYLHSTFLYYKAIGLFLLPLIFAIYVLTDKYKLGLFITGFVIIFVLYFISVFKATRIMLQKGILLFYWILYLCTVEFLPIILICKFILSKR